MCTYYWNQNAAVRQSLGTFKSAYKYEIEYDYDFSKSRSHASDNHSWSWRLFLEVSNRDERQFWEGNWSEIRKSYSYSTLYCYSDLKVCFLDCNWSSEHGHHFVNHVNGGKVNWQWINFNTCPQIIQRTINWRGACIRNLVSDFLGRFFFASKWAKFLHVTLVLMGKHSPIFFSVLLLLVFEK